MNEYKKLDLKQNALKILINSIYGAFANKYFYFHNVDIAQSITLQGQDLIKFSIRAINHYFNNLWHKDTELHQKLGIDGFKINKINEPASVYTDTDSVYMQFGSALRSIEGLPELTEEEKLRFCIDVNKYRLDGYLKQCFESYGKAYNTKNQQNFELENLSTYGIWVKKKNYAINVAYEPNKNEMLLRDIDGKSDYLIVKGLEIVKSSYPAWARDNLTKITKLFLKKGYDISIDDDIILLLKQLKEEFKLKNIDDISFNFRMGVYDKYVKSENPIVIEKGIPIYARAGVIYNNRLIVNGIEGKYEKLMEGDKIKFYYCNEKQTGVDVFAYSPGSYPIEIAPPIDYDIQFFKLIIEPVNRLLGALGKKEIDSNLNRMVNVIQTKRRKNVEESEYYPYHAVSIRTLEHSEIDEKLWKYFRNNTQPPASEFKIYLEAITRYGVDTAIVPNLELDKFIKKIKKKLDNAKSKD